MNYTKVKEAINNMEWQDAMKQMGVSQIIADEEISIQNQTKQLLRDVWGENN